MTRFYIKQKDDPHGPHIAIYVGNLPTSLSQRQYEHILVDIVGIGKQAGFCSKYMKFLLLNYRDCSCVCLCVCVYVCVCVCA